MVQKYFSLTVFTLLFSFTVTAAGEGFAIVVDQPTYIACKAEIDAYSSLLEREGFNPVLLSGVWQLPDELRQQLHHLYQHHQLEGTILVGQIPVPMIRDAQHLTSAFKMDQERFPRRDSSVPSDRFYDDFDLRFDYLGGEEEEPLLHYYSLRGDSPQYIRSDIYSGRLKPSRQGEEGYQQIRDYFRKLLREREKENPLDVVTAYTGEGSFSNSLTAWRDQGMVIREQFPATFHNKKSAKFLFYDMYPFMKELVIDELRREEMDLMLFHEHGTPDRQYLTALPHTREGGEQMEAGRRLFRQALRRTGDAEQREKLKQTWMELYQVDTLWFAGSDDPIQRVNDSLQELRTSILLEDVPLISPNARMVIFDACYNGDFREKRYIAGEYIFTEGKTLVTFANSVNVLQDKSSTDLLGLLGLGFRVGEWAREVNILESHIIGDPTHRFAGNTASRVDLRSTDTAHWLALFEEAEHPDLKGLALHKLSDLGYSRMPELLTRAYNESPYYSVRLQAFLLLQLYGGDHFSKLLEHSIRDPYEFIRRKSVYAMGAIGSDHFIPFLVKTYLDDHLDERVHFNVAFTFGRMDFDRMEAEVKRQLDQNLSYPDREKVWEEFQRQFGSRKRIAAMANDVADREKPLKARMSAAKMLRNNNYHKQVEDYLRVLADGSEELPLRVALAEAFGWFTHSCRREEIVTSLKEAAALERTPRQLGNELEKSIARIEHFMR
jgi:hypothetical protein